MKCNEVYMWNSRYVVHRTAIAELTNDDAVADCVMVGENKSQDIVPIPPLLNDFYLRGWPGFVPVPRQPFPPALVDKFADKIVLAYDRVS
jgi:hypothetical protein